MTIALDDSEPEFIGSLYADSMVLSNPEIVPSSQFI